MKTSMGKFNITVIYWGGTKNFNKKKKGKTERFKKDSIEFMVQCCTVFTLEQSRLIKG